MSLLPYLGRTRVYRDSAEDSTAGGREASDLPSQRIDQALWAVVMEAHVHGVSTRKVDDLVTALGMEAGVSKSEVSRICGELDAVVGEFRGRPLGHTAFPYLRTGGQSRGARSTARGAPQARAFTSGGSVATRAHLSKRTKPLPPAVRVSSKPPT